MAAKLLYRDAQGRDASAEVVPDGSFLGRAADCVVRTDDAMVSRKNCKIWNHGGRWYVEDLGSSNGTFVNDQRVQKQALSHADVIRCGTLQVRFVEVADTAKPRTMSLDVGGAAGVQVDPSLTGQLDPANLIALKDQELTTTAQERDALAGRLREAAQELEGVNARLETEQAELKKARTELTGLRDRFNDISRQKSLQDEELHAQHKVGEELRQELQALKAEHLTVKTRADELTEEMSARDRQLERAHEDVQRAKVATDELRNNLGALQKTKDEGWKELNSRVGELDHLREVISEQERILEERRVGMISLESSAKELRADREKVLRDTVQIKTERDQLRDQAIRSQAQIEALEDEHRRLARAISDGGGGSAAPNDDHVRLATEVRELKVALRTAENDRARLTEQASRLESERKDVDERHAKVDVEASQLREQKAAAEAARSRAEDAAARAETARQRADEEKQAAQKARELALVTSDELRREAERERKRASELEAELKKASDSPRSTTLQTIPVATLSQKEIGGDFADEEDTGEHAHAHGEPPEQRIAQLEEELAKLGTELALAQSESHPPANGEMIELKRRAEEAYTGINDALSELRTNILLAKNLVAQHGSQLPDTDAVRTLSEAIQTSMDRTEDAKGLLRALREVVES